MSATWHTRADSETGADELLLEAKNIRKLFGATRALDGASLRLRPGTVHAVLGENGAGKSSLMKIFSGVYTPDGGEILVNGRAVHWTDAAQARAAGISTIFQEFILLPNLSVGENLFLGHEPRDRFGRIDYKKIRRISVEVLGRVGLNVDPDALTGTLRVADQQMVEIAKGIMRDAQIFIFDEPTAALGESEVRQLFLLIRSLRAQGKGILYISHRLAELFEICDEVTVFKDGRFAGHFTIAETRSDQLVTAMVGRSMKDFFPPRKPNADPGATKLAFRGVQLPGFEGRVDFEIGRNEIVGFAGLEGQGQIQITRCLFEGTPPTAGQILIDGKPVTHTSAAGAISAGIGIIPEDRKAEGLFLELGVNRNILVSGLSGRLPLGVVSSDAAKVRELIRRLNIRLSGPDQPVGELSGGNQQKALLARWLYRNVEVLICEEPTRGVDIGAKLEIYTILRELADGGVPIIVTSREMMELIGLCDRIIVVSDGTTVAELPGPTATEEQIMSAALAKRETVNP
ncbi:sugar ABC transporter ATP-binding protein [Ensifer sp. YR511]|uniref:sugar ABC transporter ATP-binding protein n=1 Tax=Ensifer sp. YR511 TaxID=1855294 RepID=UPI000889ED0B|nr:sugar ABC transporter ATP-binding protein [Ensifer sp. YR511]SDN04616.1 monosaccharide ABC transporter ATP-binding protein, CUT2 family [Ensifer sp. YR511]